MFDELALPALIALTLFSGGYGIHRYRTLLNPLTIHVGLLVGVFTLGSAFSVLYLSPYDREYGLGDIAATFWLSTLNLMGVFIPYWFHGGTPSRLFGYGMAVLGLRSETIGRRFSVTRFGFLIFVAVMMYVGLMVAGGGGSLWLTDPREAYLVYRAGAGHFFVLTLWFFIFAFLYFLWSRRPRLGQLVLVTIIFGTLFLFLGKKQPIMLVAIIAVVYYNFYVHRLSLFTSIIVPLLGMVATLGLIMFQGNELLDALLYFEYFNTTALFISRFQEFGYYYGRAMITSLWVLVPRAIYPDKPFEYGASLIHQVLFPGMTETGSTPGYLLWSTSYLDFGVFGVLCDGLIIGIWQRMAYEYYLMHRRQFFAFCLMIHFSIMEIWVFVPAVVVFLWSILQVFLLRLRIIPISLASHNRIPVGPNIIESQRL